MDLANFQRDPKAFRAALLIDTDHGPRPLGECIDPWQKADFEALDPGWQRAVVGTKAKAQYQRAWLERPRGHSKSLDLAIMSTWALFASRRRLSGIAAAGDQDQARLLRDAIGRLLYVNPWLAPILEVQAYKVVNTRTKSTLEILSSDAPTSYGLTPDFAVADEITHWRKRELWDSLISSAAKRSTCIFVVITNAGLQDDWAWSVREAVRSDPAWYFSRLDGPRASWITPDRLQEQERLLPSIAFQRLWLNIWTQGGGDAIAPELIDFAFRRDLRPMTAAAPGYDYVAGLDLGVSRDASAVCVLGVRGRHDGHGHIRLAYTKIWRPLKGQKVNLAEVEDTLRRLHSTFALRQICYDPWQAHHMASRLQSGGLGQMVRGSDRRKAVPMVEVPPTGQNLQRIATAVVEAFNDRRVELYEESDLRRDLQRMRIEERSYGFRLTSPRDELGHGDLGASFSLAMLATAEVATRPRIALGAGFPGEPIDDSDDWVTHLQYLAEQARRDADFDRIALRQADDLAEQMAFLQAFQESVRRNNPF